MTKKAYALTIEIKDNTTDCGYSICFTADKDPDPDSTTFENWRQDITQAVFNASGHVFGANRKQLLCELTDDIKNINAKYKDYQIGSYNGVPAIQIDSVDGRRLEVEFNGSFDPEKNITFSRKTLAIPREVNGHGTGGIRLAEKKEFPFHGRIVPFSKGLKPPGL